MAYCPSVNVILRARRARHLHLRRTAGRLALEDPWSAAEGAAGRGSRPERGASRPERGAVQVRISHPPISRPSATLHSAGGSGRPLALWAPPGNSRAVWARAALSGGAWAKGPGLSD